MDDEEETGEWGLRKRARERMSPCLRKGVEGRMVALDWVLECETVGDKRGGRSGITWTES